LVVIFLFNIFLSEIPVGDARLRELALQLYMETASILQGVQMPANFAFSNGWLSNFKHNNKIKAYVGHGEEGSVDMELNGPKFEDIANHLSDYHPSNIYNCDETGLYLRVLSNKSLSQSTVLGRKPDSEGRVSILLCTNADGSDKLPPFILCKMPSKVRGKMLITELPGSNITYSINTHFRRSSS
jgi:hypothetical protein